MSKSSDDPDKWNMTPLQVLTRARECVMVGSHSTAQEAIGCDTAEDCHKGSPLTPAFGLLLASFWNTRASKEKHEECYLAYQAISDFGQKPNQVGEIQALERAIAFTKVLTVLEQGKALTGGQIVTETGLTWDQVDAALLALESRVFHIPTSPECFVLREFLEP
jgi:hypothetical protein